MDQSLRVLDLPNVGVLGYSLTVWWAMAMKDPMIRAEDPMTLCLHQALFPARMCVDV